MDRVRGQGSGGGIGVSRVGDQQDLFNSKADESIAMKRACLVLVLFCVCRFACGGG